MNSLYIFLSILIPPIVGSVMLYIYKSKCTNIRLCYGLVEVKRDVIGEEKIDISSNQNNATIINSI